MSVFAYKKYSHKDLDTYFSAFKKILRHEFPVYSPETKEFILTYKRGWSEEKYHMNKYKYIYGAWSDNRLVGMAIGNSDFGGVVFLEWLMVEGAYQKLGAGKFLASEFEKTVREKGQHAIFLWCEDKNVAFYKKLGYKHESRTPNLWFGITTNMMVKQIQPPHPTPWVKE